MNRFLLVSYIVVFNFSAQVSAQVFAGPDSPGTSLQVPNIICSTCPGSNWNSMSSVFVLDGICASTSLTLRGTCMQSNCYYSRFFEVSNFGFNIPSTATILGIKVEIDRWPSVANSVKDSIIRLMKGVTPVGPSHSMAGAWSTTRTYYTYGGSSDLWGSTWTPAQINSNTTRVMIRVKNISPASATAYIDHLRMTAYYSTPSGIVESQSSVAQYFSVYQDENQLHFSFNRFSEEGNSVLKIYDLTGREVISKSLGALPEGDHTELIGTEELKTGIYFAQLISNKGNISRKFFISK